MSLFDLDILISHSKKIRLQQLRDEASITKTLAMRISSRYRRALIDKLVFRQREAEMRTGKKIPGKEKYISSQLPSYPTPPPPPPDTMYIQPPVHAPVYPRINRKFLDIATLTEYQVPWEFDRVGLASWSYRLAS